MIITTTTTVISLLGTGNFGRVVPDDVLIACGKKTLSPPILQSALATNVSDPQQKKPFSVAPAQVMDGRDLRNLIFKYFFINLTIILLRSLLRYKDYGWNAKSSF